MNDKLTALAKQFADWTDQRRGVSPLYEAIVVELVNDEQLLRLIAEASNPSYIQNRFMAAVHFLLLEGCRHPLSEHYATVTSSPPPASGAYPHFRDFCFTHREELLHLVETREVQINEVRRCGVLLPAFTWAWENGGNRPLALLDVGAAAGLNLLVDHFYYDFGLAGSVGDASATVKIACAPRGTMAPPVPKQMLPIGWRMGIDPQPVDVTDTRASNWLVALTSPDDNQRLSLLKAALTIARQDQPKIMRGTACDVLPDALASAPQHLSLCVYHSFTTHHFQDWELARFDALLAEFGKKQDYTVISLEWERTGGVAQTRRPVPIKATTFFQGKRNKELLGCVDNRGGCEWLEWLHSSG